MHKILTFPDHLRLINERSTAFRAAVAAAPSLDLQVPTHPERTLFDLVQHVGMGRRKSAAIVAAGPADAPPEMSAWDDGMGAPREREALLAWWTASVEQLTSALREAGPDRGCWTWWGDCDSPQTSGAWARRQVPEIAVHTYDAQLTVGAAQPLSEEVALDGAKSQVSVPVARNYWARRRMRSIFASAVAASTMPNATRRPSLDSITSANGASRNFLHPFDSHLDLFAFNLVSARSAISAVTPDPAAAAKT